MSWELAATSVGFSQGAAQKQIWATALNIPERCKNFANTVVFKLLTAYFSIRYNSNANPSEAVLDPN